MFTLDYYVFGGIHQQDRNAVVSLKTTKVDEFAAMPSAEMKRACSRFRIEAQAVREAEGDFIE